MFVGGNSRYVEDAYAINASLKRGLCSVIKVSAASHHLLAFVLDFSYCKSVSRFPIGFHWVFGLTYIGFVTLWGSALIGLVTLWGLCNRVCHLAGSVSDPDLDSGVFWIRIRIRNPDPDPEA